MVAELADQCVVAEMDRSWLEQIGPHAIDTELVAALERYGDVLTGGPAIATLRGASRWSSRVEHADVAFRTVAFDDDMAVLVASVPGIERQAPAGPSGAP